MHTIKQEARIVKEPTTQILEQSINELLSQGYQVHGDIQYIAVESVFMILLIKENKLTPIYPMNPL